jgi:hypothetical protein
MIAPTVQVAAAFIDSYDDLCDHLQHLNYDAGVDVAIVITRDNSTWMAYSTDPDGEWCIEIGDPRERINTRHGDYGYEAVGLDWIEQRGPFRVIDRERLSA